MKKIDKLKFSDVFWIFILGGLIGYALEIVWHFLRKHIWLIKNGVLFGPFQPVYALGLCFISILFFKLKDKKWIYLLLLGSLFGFIFEYIASLFQQYCLGTYTWNYAKFGKLAIHGRVYVPYCFGWGLMMYVWMKCCFTPVVLFFRKIPEKINTIIVTCLLSFMIFNFIATAYVFHRKADRYQEIAPRNTIEHYIDKKYNDDFLDKRFPNLWIYR